MRYCCSLSSVTGDIGREPMSTEEARRNGSRACEQKLQTVGKDSAQTLREFAAHDAFVAALLRRWDEYMTGVTPHGLLLMLIGTTTSLLGPITAEYITGVHTEDGSQSVWPQPQGTFYLFVGGPGTFKSGTQDLAADATQASIDLFTTLKDSLGGNSPANEWVSHFHPTDTMFRDGSTSNWFDRLKSNPRLNSLLYLCDEIDVVLKRVKSDKSSGELAAWLQLWNVGNTFAKATGQISV